MTHSPTGRPRSGGAGRGRARRPAERSARRASRLFKGPRRPHRRDRHEHRRASVDDPARRHGAGEQDAIRNHPLLKGVNVDTNWGRRGHAAMMATLDAALRDRADGRQPAASFGIDKKTGKRVGPSDPAGRAGYGLMTYMHQASSTVVLPVQRRLYGVGAAVGRRGAAHVGRLDARFAGRARVANEVPGFGLCGRRPLGAFGYRLTTLARDGRILGG